MGESLWSCGAASLAAEQDYAYSACVEPTSCHVNENTDAHGDGLCCNQRSGGYELSYGKNVVQSGDSFGSGVSYALGEG
jgi:hypothetical protein